MTMFNCFAVSRRSRSSCSSNGFSPIALLTSNIAVSPRSFPALGCRSGCNTSLACACPFAVPKSIFFITLLLKLPLSEPDPLESSLRLYPEMAYSFAASVFSLYATRSSGVASSGGHQGRIYLLLLQPPPAP